MSFMSDLNNDVDHVFFDDYGVSALLVRGDDSLAAEPTAIRCIVGRGLDRFVDGGYIKNSWEIEFKASDKVRPGDQVQIPDKSGAIVRKYLVGNQADRTGETATFAAKVDK